MGACIPFPPLSICALVDMRKVNSQFSQINFETKRKVPHLILQESWIDRLHTTLENRKCALGTARSYHCYWHQQMQTKEYNKEKTKFKFGDTNIEIVDDYTYLGVIFNYSNWFSKTVNAQVNQVRRALFSMLNKSYNLSLPPDIQIKLFDQLVLPVLLYGCEIWAFRNTYQTEALHTKFCKSILKLSKYTPNCMVYGELGQHKMKLLLNWG